MNRLHAKHADLSRHSARSGRADPSDVSGAPAEAARAHRSAIDGIAATPAGSSSASPFAALRVLLFAAHPDDEVLGAGGQFHAMEQLSIVHLTDGAWSHREAWRRGWLMRHLYARARRRESIAAARLSGTRFDYVNLKFRDRAATFGMAAATLRLVGVIRDHRPDLMLTHPYEGGHPDHDAAAFVACAACRLAGGVPLWEMASYHAAEAHSDGLGAATGRTLNTAVTAGVFLDPPSAGAPSLAVRLTPAVLNGKRQMLDCFASQRPQLDEYGFDLSVERFRPAPDYDFNLSPHHGRLLYETQPWARMTGSRWRAAAAQARAELERR